MPQDTKEIIQFKHIHHEQVAGQQQAKQKAAYKKRAILHGAIGGEEQQKVCDELDVEKEKAAAIKNQVQTAKNPPEAQQHRAVTASKEVAEMQQEWRDSVKLQAAEDTRANENTA